MITAHSGALNTGRNIRKFLDIIKNYRVDVIEVDVRRKGSLLYISHNRSLRAAKCVALKEIFEYIKVYDFKVNCDIKERGIVREVIALAKESGVTDRLILTGNVRQKDIIYIDCGTVYVDSIFYRPLKLEINNLEIIKALIDGFENEHIRGLSLPYSFATKGFLLKSMGLNLNLSLYTVDDVSEIKRFLSFGADNVTTNLVKEALDIRKELQKNQSSEN